MVWIHFLLNNVSYWSAILIFRNSNYQPVRCTFVWKPFLTTSDHNSSLNFCCPLLYIIILHWIVYCYFSCSIAQHFPKWLASSLTNYSFSRKQYNLYQKYSFQKKNVVDKEFIAEKTLLKFTQYKVQGPIMVEL